MSPDLTPPPLTAAQLQATDEFVRIILNRLRGDDGVQAEIAVSTAARMAGTYMLRSFGLHLADREAGSAVVSERGDAQRPILIAAIRETLVTLECPLDSTRIPNRVPAANEGHNTILQTQLTFGVPFRNTIRKLALTDNEAAYAAALAAARIIKDCAPVLDPHISFAIAVAGCTEGMRSVPLTLPGDEPETPGEHRPWYRFW